MNKKILASSIAMLTGALVTAPAMAEPEVAVSGVIETELASTTNSDKTKVTEITLATVELGVDAKVTDKVDGHMLFLYEEGEGDSPLMDEGTISYAFGGSSVTMGKTYVPFGVFDTAIISDPLTLELGETNEVVLMYSNATGMFNVDLYLFNGEIDTIDTAAAGDDTDMGYGFNVGLSKEDVFSVSLGYISNIADTDGITGFAAGIGNNTMDAFVAGLAISASASFGPVSLMLEQVSAMDKFSNLDFGGASAATDMQPSAAMVDLAVDLGTVGLGFSFQSTADADFLGLPETAFGVAAHFGIADNTSLGAEFASWDEYNGTSGSQFLVQLATEF